MSFVQDNGVMRSAPTGSKGYHIFSEVGAGTKPLCLVGMWHEVVRWLSKHKKGGIDNQIPDLPEVYMGSMFYRPSNRFKGLFPMHDAAKALTEGFAGFGAAGVGDAFGGGAGKVVTDIAGGIKDSVEVKRGLFSRKKITVSKIATNPIAVVFSYLPKYGGMRLKEVGSGLVTYDEMFLPVLKSIRASCGT